MSSLVPETPSRIREVLAERGLAPRKRLGQHFLADSNLRDTVVASAGVRPGDLVLEVGPGLGTLTKGLLDAGARVLAVELDRGMAEFLADAFAGEERLTLLQTDALERKVLAPAVREALAAARVGAERFLLVANLPYGAGTPVIASLVRDEVPPDRVVVMVQKEVAERMAAVPGTRAYGPLAVLLSLRGRPRILREVGGKVFTPHAPVRSALFSFEPVADPPALWPLADRAARQAFLHRRKSLRRSLLSSGHRAEVVERALKAVGADKNVRAEELSPQDFVAIGRELFASPV